MALETERPRRLAAGSQIRKATGQGSKYPFSSDGAGGACNLRPETTWHAARLLPSAAGGMTVPVTVSQLAIAPVKGMRLQRASEIQLGPYGITGDREFLVIGEG